MRSKSNLRGILRKSGNNLYLEAGGKELFKDRLIWDGYSHFEGMEVSARELPQKDYSGSDPIILIWPYGEPPAYPYLELYYNERLVGKILSRLGHIALNVNGRVFNYSYFINESEEQSVEEYLYRPILGEFAKSPDTGAQDFSDPFKPYYHKPGRLFMRSVNVLHIRGADTERLMNLSRKTLSEILNYPRDPRKPYKYDAYNYFTNNCVNLLVKDLRKAGFRSVSGPSPRDLFIRTAYNIIRGKTQNKMSLSAYRLDQIRVPSEPLSAPTPMINPVNKLRELKIKDKLKIKKKDYWGEGGWE